MFVNSKALKKLYISLKYNVNTKAVVLFAYEFDFHTYTECGFLILQWMYHKETVLFLSLVNVLLDLIERIDIC